MINLLTELKRRNIVLFWFGWFNIIVGLICIMLMPLEELRILGVNRWLKPMKFYFSVGIMVWTMGWIMFYLTNTGIVKKFSWLILVSMLFENGFILLQAIRKTTSHFNVAIVFDEVIFQLMGIFILIFTLTSVFIAISFFTQRSFQITEAYTWGIRLGLVFFIFFSIEGGVMVAQLKHTVGATDGTPGLPFFNWSTKYGDLRVAHFFGIHALQLIPLAGKYLAKSKEQLFFIAIGYFVLVIVFMLQALYGIPLSF